jgi:hypothetical protein
MTYTSPADKYIKHAPKWEPVTDGGGIAWTADGHMNIHTWRLSIPGGWLYKVTERYEDRFVMQICFVPKGATEPGDKL